MTLVSEIVGTEVINGNSDENYTLEQVITGIAKASNSSPEQVKQELFSMKLPEGIARSLSMNYFNSKLNAAFNDGDEIFVEPANSEPQQEQVNPEPTKAETPEEVDPRALLKQMALPSQLGALKNLVPIAPPTRANKTELEQIKALIKAGLLKLNKKADKHRYILDHMMQASTAGQIYLEAFVGVYESVDTTDTLKRSRPGKIAKAVKAIIEEDYPSAEEAESEAA